MTTRSAILALLSVCALAVTTRAGTLWRTDFEAADLPGRTAYSSNGTVTASSGYGTGLGTILTVGSNAGSQGVSLAVNGSAAAGPWTAGVTTGVVALTTPNATITNLGLVTLSFSLRASTPHPVVVRVESFDASNNRTGGLRTLIYPATANYYQRFAVDLSTMTADGTGTFNPLNPKIAVSFELDSAAGGDGWPNAAGLTLNVDNLHYATPAYYVKPAASGGSDSNSTGAGTTEATAFATPNFALGKAVAGDIIAVKGGTYTGSSINFAAKAGAPDAWISVRNYPGETPVIRYTMWNAVYVGSGTKSAPYSGAPPAYLEVRGLTVRGYSLVDAVTGDRNMDPAIVPDLVTKIGVFGETNQNGISVEGRYMDQVPHDFRFADNVVENCPGGGISVIRGDRVMIENNLVRNNCWWMIYGGSGISFLRSTDVEANADTRTVVQGNQCYANETMVPWLADSKFSDGNGIIIDSNRNKDYQASIPDPAYLGKTLVQNNLSFNNGGSGIHSYASQNVDIFHNAAYLNSASQHLAYGPIFAGRSQNVQMRGNILVAPTNVTGSSTFNEPITNSSSGSSNVAGTIYFQNNLYSGGNVALPSDANFSNNVNADPKFLAATINAVNGNFHLRATSPGRNAAPGIATRSVLDVARRPRMTGTADQGAYQTQTGEDSAPFFTPAAGNFPAGSTSVTLGSDLAGAKFLYTLDGSTPTVDPATGTAINGTENTGTAIPLSAATTLKAIAWKSGSPTSVVTAGAYTFNNLAATAIPELIFYPPGGSYATAPLVGVICRTPGALIRYTLDGSTPTPTTGTLLPQSMLPITLGQTLKAIAYLPGRANSPVHAETYNTVNIVTDPVVTVGPATTLSRTLPPSFTATNAITLTNPGASPHAYTLSVRGPGAATSFAVKKTGDAGGPLYEWQEITTTGTVNATLDGTDDTSSGPFTLGFAFPFYGTDFTTARMCSNGFLSFTSTAAPFTNLSLPSASAPGNLVAPFWDDLYMRADTVPVAHAYTRQANGNAFIAQWSSASSYDSSSERLTAQAILKAGGEITFQYLNNTIAASRNATIGTQNANGTVGQNVAYNTAYATDGLAVRLTPQGPSASWLNVTSPAVVTVPAGGSVTVNLQVGSTGLAAGSYAANVQVSSDSALHPLTLLPVSLTVANALTWAQWQALWFTAAQAANPLIGGPFADPDGDGVNNLMERSMGRSPTAAQPFAPLFTTQLDANGRLALTFTRDTTAGDLTYTVLASGDLVTWTPIASSTNGAATVNLNNLSASVVEGTGNVRTVTVTDAGTVGPRFLRLEVKLP